MRISVVVPAFNEEKLLSRCLSSIRTAFAASMKQALLHEVIVVDNNSTDRTAAIAGEAGVQVVFEPVNQISRARNAGGLRATGDWLLFIDADSILTSGSVDDLVACIGRGDSAGGGSIIDFLDGPVQSHAAAVCFNAFMRVTCWAAGSFVFCRADAFRDVGGFSTEVYAGEEIFFSRALKRWARDHGLRMTILARHPHRSSARKLRLYSLREQVELLLRSLFFPVRTIRDPKRLGYFYDGRR